MYKKWGKIPYYSNNYGEETVAVRYFYDNDNNLMALDVQEPIENNKIALVSWRLCGSEFVKECIKENFPEYCKDSIWCKAHGILPEDVKKEFLLNNTKIVVVMMDPRDAAANIQYYNNGQFYNKEEYNILDDEESEDKKFLDAVAEKQIDLLNYYQQEFGENCIAVRYEDACYHQDKLLSELSNFFHLPSLNIDDTAKYKSCIYKKIGDFGLYYSEDDLDQHLHCYEDFYISFNYNDSKHKKQINYEMSQFNKINYLDFLKRNRITLDEQIAERIISNDIKSF